MSPPEAPNLVLTDLFAAHGYTVTPYNGWVVVNNTLPVYSATAFDRTQPGSGRHLLQLDVRAVFPPNLTITEAFAGFGDSDHAALLNAFENFTVNSFHVFLTAFCGQENEQCAVETWQTGGDSGRGGTPYRAVIGNFGVRGGPNRERDTIAATAFHRLADRIRARELTAPLHWFRLFYSRAPGSGSGSSGQGTTCEVMWDNEPWPDAQAEIAALSWPEANVFYSVRCFTVLQAVPNAVADQ